ncbi:MAG: protein-L-isoaspartate O-methyltransferase [Pseudomonadota bacterium]
MSEFAEARRQMVAGQIRVHDVTDKRVQDAMFEIERESFVPRAQHPHAYADLQIDGGEGRTLLRPRDFAKLVQAAGVRTGDVVLDIACGRGYSTAVLARLADTVVGLEDSEAAVEKATERLAAAGADNAVVVHGELKAGMQGQGPFNVIFVGGAVDAVPQAWFDQLADGGRLAVFVRDDAVGRAMVYTRAGDRIGERAVFDGAPALLPGFEPEAGFVF